MFPLQSSPLRASRIRLLAPIVYASVLRFPHTSQADPVEKAVLSQVAPSVGRAVLTGTITDEKGFPLSGATVFLYTAAPRVGTSPYCPSCFADCAKSAKTDAKGAFRLAALDPSLIFRVLVVRDSYESAFVAKVDPAIGPMRATLKALPLQETHPRRVVQGRIIDPEGKPVMGAVVSLVEAQVMDGETIGGSGISVEPLAISDANGVFRLHVSRGVVTCTAHIEARGFAPQVVRALDAGRPAKTIPLSLGAMASGTVLDAQGKGMPGVTVQMVPKNLENNAVSWFEIGTDKYGNFGLPNLPSGQDYYLMARMDTLAGQGRAAVRQTITLPKNADLISGIKLKTEPGLTIAGRVVLSDGKTIPAGTRLMLGRTQTWDAQQPELAPDGSFQFQGVPRNGTLDLAIRVRGYHPETPQAFKLEMKGRSVQNLELRLVPDAPRPVTSSPSRRSPVQNAPEPAETSDPPLIDLDRIEVKLIGLGAKRGREPQWWDAQGDHLASTFIPAEYREVSILNRVTSQERLLVLIFNTASLILLELPFGRRMGVSSIGGTAIIKT